MARAIHEHWRKTQEKAGRPATTWEDLDESRRHSSRHQARYIPVKLRKVGCALTPLRSWDATDFKFTDKEVEMLAVEEHDRWNRERIADGWTLLALPQGIGEPEEKRLIEEGKRRKQTPYLVSWEQLPADIAEWDAVFVRAIPEILALAGMQVVRLQVAETPAAEPVLSV
jgi:hypothetical protein